MSFASIRSQLRDHAPIQLANAVFILSGLGIHIYLSRGGLPFEAYGTFSVLLSLLTTASLLFTGGFPFYAVQRYSRDAFTERDIFSLIALDFLICTALFALVLLGQDTIGALLFSDASHGEYLPLIAAILFAYLTYSFVLGYINARREYSRQSMVIISHSIAKCILAVVLAHWLGISGALLAYGIPGLIATIIAATRSSQHWRIPLKELAAGVRRQWQSREMWSFVIPTTTYGFLNGAIIAKDILIVENVLPATQLSVYAILITIGRVPLHVITALGLVMFPNYSRHSDTQDLRTALRRDLPLELALIVAAIVAYVLLGGFVLELLYGSDFREHTSLLVWVVVSGCVYSLRALFCVKLQACGRQYASLVATAVSFAILCFLGRYVVETYGLFGAAINMLISSLPVLLVIMYYSYNRGVHQHE